MTSTVLLLAMAMRSDSAKRLQRDRCSSGEENKRKGEARQRIRAGGQEGGIARSETGEGRPGKLSASEPPQLCRLPPTAGGQPQPYCYCTSSPVLGSLAQDAPDAGWPSMYRTPYAQVHRCEMHTLRHARQPRGTARPSIGTFLSPGPATGRRGGEKKTPAERERERGACVLFSH